MAFDLSEERQQAHAYLDQLPAAQLSAIRRLLKSMVDPLAVTLGTAPVDDEELTEQEAGSIRRSREWFKHNEGTPFEDVVAELGFTIEEIRNHRDQD